MGQAVEILGNNVVARALSQDSATMLTRAVLVDAVPRFLSAHVYTYRATTVVPVGSSSVLIDTAVYSFVAVARNSRSKIFVTAVMVLCFILDIMWCYI